MKNVVNQEVNAFVSFANTFQPLTYQEVIKELKTDYPTEPNLREEVIKELNRLNYFYNEKTKKE
jgi:hypothetical protein